MPPQRTTRRGPVRAMPDNTKRNAGKQFWDAQIRIVLGGEPAHITVCQTCAALVTSGEKAQQRHLDWHRLLQEAVEAALPR
jgi:hypothetical protein